MQIFFAILDLCTMLLHFSCSSQCMQLNTHILTQTCPLSSLLRKCYSLKFSLQVIPSKKLSIIQSSRNNDSFPWTFKNHEHRFYLAVIVSVRLIGHSQLCWGMEILAHFLFQRWPMACQKRTLSTYFSCQWKPSLLDLIYFYINKLWLKNGA